MSDNLSSTAAVIAGSFSDYRLVKSRGVLQLVVEIPVEQQGDAFAALGYPIPGTDIPVAVARLNSPVGPHSPQHERTTSAALDGRANHKPAGESHKRSWYELPASQRAALLCQDVRFQQWVLKKYGAVVSGPSNDEENAKAFLYQECNIKSRTELTTNDYARNIFYHIERPFRVWAGLEAEPR